jgi:hypothetical protein
MDDTSNGLDLSKIHPSNGPKYSPNLYRWLSDRKKTYRARLARVYADDKGILWIGHMDDLYFIGTRLMTVLCDSTAGTMAHSRASKCLVELTAFWDSYAKVGRCAMDPGHVLGFVGDDLRWEVDGKRRHCVWCGKATQVLKSYVTQTHDNWVNVE